MFIEEQRGIVMHSKTLSIGAAVALAAATTTAFAGAPASSGVIALTRFDLASSAGQAQLDRTIRRTALQMCATESTVDAPQAKHLERLCYQDAVANARAQITSGQTASLASNGAALAALETSAPRN
jgi:UrcA family protein